MALVNYLITGLSLFFLIDLGLIYRSQKQTKSVRFFQAKLISSKLILLIIGLVGNGVIIIERNYQQDSILVLVLTISIVLIVTIISSIHPYMEPIVWHIIVYLQVIGIITLHSLQVGRALRQSMIALIGYGLMLMVCYVIQKINFLEKLTYVYIGLSIGLLVISNSTLNGATNWFQLFDLSFQPSEFVKIIFAFSLGAIFRKERSLKRLVIGTVYSAVLVLILVYQRDLGGAFLFFAMYAVLSYLYYRKRWISMVQLVGISFGGVAAYHLFGHVRVRILSWLDPFSYIDKEGYQITQGLFAIANGKYMGVGLTEGASHKVPAVTTDFIFAAINEKLGVVMGLIIIVLFFFLVIVLLSQCQKNKRIFPAYLSVGISVMLGFQAFLILGGVLKLIPLTGVTLPFISSGGSSLIASYLSVGVIESMAKSSDQSGKYEYREHTIITIKYVMTALYAALLAYMLYFVVFQSDEIELNSYNSRLPEIEKSIIRGSIYDRKGNILVETQIVETEQEEQAVRNYRYDGLFAHVIGYSDVGKTGLEARYNMDLLRSSRPLLERIGKMFDPNKKQGDSLHLTLDLELQKIAAQSLGKRKGAVVAIEVDTGKILAMVSQPSFNPNTMAKDYQYLLNDQEATLLNRVTNGLYPPGSTFKVVTALAYAQQKGVDFEYQCQGKAIFGQRLIHCYKDRAHGQESIADAFAYSCNTAFAQMANKMEPNQWRAKAEQLYFNRNLPYDLNHQVSRFRLDLEATEELIAETGIGQGETLITPLHNLLITAAIANGGQLMRPYLLDTITNERGQVVKQNLPKPEAVILSEAEVRQLQDYMTEAVRRGTAQGLSTKQYTAAGKTGSAENPFGKAHAWFIGYAPAKQPKIAVSIIVENAGTSSQNAVPIAGKIFDAYLTN